jgi:hypothetical protein
VRDLWSWGTNSMSLPYLSGAAIPAVKGLNQMSLPTVIHSIT